MPVSPPCTIPKASFILKSLCSTQIIPLALCNIVVLQMCKMVARKAMQPWVGLTEMKDPDEQILSSRHYTWPCSHNTWNILPSPELQYFQEGQRLSLQNQSNNGKRVLNILYERSWRNWKCLTFRRKDLWSIQYNYMPLFSMPWRLSIPWGQNPCPIYLCIANTYHWSWNPLSTHMYEEFKNRKN